MGFLNRLGVRRSPRVARATRPTGRRRPSPAGQPREGKGLVPPKYQVYKRFLYIDGAEVINTLAALEGGFAEETVERTIQEGNWNIGLSIKQWAGLDVGMGKKRTLQQDVRRKRTAHSAVEGFLAQLEGGDGIGSLSRRCDDEEWQQLEENMVLSIDGFLDVIDAFESEVEWKPGLLDRWLKTPAPMPKGWAVAVADADRPDDQRRLVMRLEHQYMLEPESAFTRSAVVVGQVERILRDKEICVLTKAGAFEFKQQSDHPPDPLWQSWTEPVAFLRPICIYK